ncbi:MAG: hypothetical protein WC495_06255 [Patescibacteria group bacterium]
MNNFITELSEFHGQQYTKPKRAFIQALEVTPNNVVIAKISVPIPTKDYAIWTYTLYCESKSQVDEAVERENEGIKRLEIERLEKKMMGTQS